MTIDFVRLRYALIVSLGWFPVALYSVFIKNVNIELRYFSLFYKFSGLTGIPSISDRLYIYLNDLVFSFFLVPLFIICCVYAYPRKKTIFVFSFLSLIVLILLFANMHSWGTMGRPLGYSALADAAVFALQEPKFIRMYVDYGSWTKLGILIVSTLFCYVGAGFISRIRYLNNLAASGVVVLLVMVVVLTGVGLRSGMKKADIFTNFIWLSAYEFVEPEVESQQLGEKDKSVQNTLQAFYALTDTTKSVESPFTGKATGNDLIIYIIETGPVEFIDLAHDIGSFPTLKFLASKSLIAYDHYATYPGSAQSLFSLFFSVYPPYNYYQSCIAKKMEFSHPFPGFVSRLTASGYQGRLYLPYTDVIPLDTILHTNMGVQEIFYAQEHAQAGESCDRIAWNKMKDDIKSFIADLVKNDTKPTAYFGLKYQI